MNFFIYNICFFLRSLTQPSQFLFVFCSDYCYFLLSFRFWFFFIRFLFPHLLFRVFVTIWLLSSTSVLLCNSLFFLLIFSIFTFVCIWLYKDELTFMRSYIFFDIQFLINFLKLIFIKIEVRFLESFFLGWTKHAFLKTFKILSKFLFISFLI